MLQVKPSSSLPPSVSHTYRGAARTIPSPHSKPSLPPQKPSSSWGSPAPWNSATSDINGDTVRIPSVLLTLGCLSYPTLSCFELEKLPPPHIQGQLLESSVLTFLTVREGQFTTAANENYTALCFFDNGILTKLCR